MLICRDFTPLHTLFHRCGKVASLALSCAFEAVDYRPRRSRCAGGFGRSSILGDRPPPRPSDTLFSREANVPAERAQAEAPARIPGANVDSRGPRDPQAPARQGAQAPLRVSGKSEPTPPPFPLARLRRRLPQGPVRLDPVPGSLLVPARRGPAR